MGDAGLLLLALMVAMVALSALARLVDVPYPILLVLGGLLLGFVPGMPALVLATMGAVAVTAHALIGGLPWAAAFTLGAIVAPTDPLAATAIGRRLDDPPLEIMLSLVTGYAAYLPADRLGVSGVLAAVTSGLYVGWRNPQIASASTRLLGFSFWDVLVYLLNAVLFLLVGLQLHPILSGVTGGSAAALLGQAALVTVVVVAVRITWQFTVPYLDRLPTQVVRRLSAAERLVVGWSGMRGAVSLAAALALPFRRGSARRSPSGT